MRKINTEIVFNNILWISLKIPGTKIDKTEFLTKELGKFCTKKVLKNAIKTSPLKAGIESCKIEDICNSIIKKHTKEASYTSLATGLPGGILTLVAIPGDFLQFYTHLLLVIQKLAYLHGEPEFFKNNHQIKKDTLKRFTFFLGKMSCARGIQKVVVINTNKIAAKTFEKIQEKEITKKGIYLIIASCKKIGVKFSEEAIKKGLSKIIPIVGGVSSGYITYISMKKMTNNLKLHLETTNLK